MRRSSVHRLATVALVALLVAGTSPASAGTAQASGDLGSSPTVTSSGPFRVLTHASGSTVVWQPSTQVRHGDARLELAVDGEELAARLTPLGDGTWSAVLPGVTSVAPSKLSVVAAGRVIDGAKVTKGVTKTAPTAVKQPEKLVKNDPGVPGKHKTVSFTYSQPSVKLDELPVKVETRARVVLPATSAKGARGVVVFLHGRHSTCFSAEGEDSGDWPCPPGFKQVPSYLGYEYAQELLASQGFATVSISANGINGQDWEPLDAGAGARAQLIEHHLDLLAKWNAKGGKGDLKKLKGRLNLKKIVLVGHSRGGEGANRATIELARSKSYRVRGQVLVAPTDFGFQTSPAVPTSVLLPYCDGDVYDLQGQAFVDQGRYVTPNDRAQKSAVMFFGANHNYFNTEWTPGQSKAPAWDDWWEPADKTCGDKAPGRLSAKQQQSAGATYVAASVRAFLTGDKDSTRLLDGSPVRARSAGKAVVLSAGFTGYRTELFSAASKVSVKGSGGASAELCASGFADYLAICELLSDFAPSPHWLLFGENKITPWARAVYADWDRKGAKVRITPDSVRDLSRSSRLDLRVATFGKGAAFDVVLTDSKGRSLTLTPERQAVGLPAFLGGPERVWAQTVRVKIPAKAKKFNLKKVRSVTLRATSAKGKIFVLDAFTSSTAKPKFLASRTKKPVFNAVSASYTVGETASGLATIQATVKVRGNSTKPSRVAVVAQSTSGDSVLKVVQVPAGTRSIKVPLSVPADGVYSAWNYGTIGVLPLRNAVTSDYVGFLDFQSSTPVPTVSFPTTHVEVTQGETIEWPYQLSGPTSDMVMPFGYFEAPDGGLPELSSANVPVSLYSAIGWFPPSTPAPISETGLNIVDVLAPLKLRGTLDLPTRSSPKLTEVKHVKVVVPEDGFYILSPITLTATIKPAP